MKYAIRTLILGILMGVSFYGFSAAEPSGAMLRKVEQLKQLKESDPQAYRDFINQKREKVRERYGQLKEQGPEKMGRFMNRHKKRRWERLRKMKEDNPEQFEEFLNRRMSRFAEKAKQNPERFNAMLENRPEFRRRFEQWQGWQDGNKFVGGEDSAQNSRQVGSRPREMTGDKPTRPKGHQVDARPVQMNSEHRKRVMPGENRSNAGSRDRDLLRSKMGVRKPLRQGGNNPPASGSGQQRGSANFR